ncbi:MAG: hypothetical protein Q7U54_03530 [Bacteroidales bacterium]|nr:hypothetical protein [Bacteroidales bacterium]
MKIKLLCLIIISVVFLSNKGISQVQVSYTGSRKNLQTNVVEAVRFTYSNYSKQNIYYTHYSIFRKVKASKSDTIYSIDFDFDKSNNSIKISQFDWKANQYYSKTVDFKPLSALSRKSNFEPKYCVKNYILNDTLISMTNDENASIFFTIDDTTNAKISLHQLVTYDGNYRFDLDKFRKSSLTAHLSHARDYWDWLKEGQTQADHNIKRVRDSILIAQRAALQVKINDEILNINSDKNYELDKLTKKLDDVKKLPDTIANAKAQELFTRRMDKIFSEYLSGTQCSKTEITGSYKFYVYPNQTVSIVKQPPMFLMDWRVAQQFSIIDTLIKKIPLEKTEVSICSEDPYNIIFQKHLSRSESLKPEIIIMDFKFDSVFKTTLDSAQIRIKSICNTKFPVTTTYTYPFTYLTKSEWGIWTLSNKKIKKYKDSLIDNKKNIDQFYSERPNAKNGRYNVRLNTTILNNRTYGPDLDSVNLKYKYWTRIGFMVGTFISNDGKFTTGADATTGEIYYWNLSLIYHHIGVFGGMHSNYGKSSLPQSDADSTISYLKNYTEAGLYVAPGKFFYFKLGIAKYTTINKNSAGNAINESKSIIMPIVGGSFMFPVFQLEGGYNFALKYPYVMAGFNIPINF